MHGQLTPLFIYSQSKLDICLNENGKTFSLQNKTLIRFETWLFDRNFVSDQMEPKLKFLTLL